MVRGMSIATVSAGPTPGSTPMNVPSVTPMNPHSRFNGVSAMLKPCSNGLKGFGHERSNTRAAEESAQPASRRG